MVLSIICVVAKGICTCIIECKFSLLQYEDANVNLGRKTNPSPPNVLIIFFNTGAVLIIAVLQGYSIPIYFKRIFGEFDKTGPYKLKLLMFVSIINVDKN